MEPKTPEASILFVHGDEEIQRHVYEKYGYGYWSAAFDSLLEKHGWLDFETAHQGILDKENILNQYSVLIVAWLPAAYWKDSYVKALKNYPGLVFIEGPLPQKIADVLGYACDDGRSSDHGKLLINDPSLAEWIGGRFEYSLWGRTDVIELSPKVVEIKKRELARQELRVGPEHDRATRLHDATLSYMLAYRNRFKRYGYFFQEDTTPPQETKFGEKLKPKGSFSEMMDAFALLAWCRFASKLDPGVYLNSFCNFLQEVLGKLVIPEKVPGRQNDLIALAARSLALATAAKFIQDDSLKQKSKKAADLFVRSLGFFDGNAISVAWTILLEVHTGKEISKDQINKLVKKLPGKKAKAPAQLIWLAAEIMSCLPKNVTVDLGQKLSQLLPRNNASSSKNILMELEGRTLWECFLIGAALAISGRSKEAENILESALDQAYHADKGLFLGAIVKDGAFEVIGGTQVLPWVPLGLIEVLGAFSLWDPSQALTAYDSKQLARWEQSPLIIGRCRLTNASHIIPLACEEDVLGGIFKKKKKLASSFSILAHLVHFHTMHPLSEAFYDCKARDFLALEHLFFHILEKEQDSHNIPGVQVESWPWGKSYCLAIRHDVDRPMTEEVFRQLFNYEVSRGLGVSWYWLAGRLNPDQIRELESAGHEIGLHSMRLATKKEELFEVEAHLKCQECIYGEQWHGGGGGDYWIGHPSIRSAVDCGFLYTEFVATINDLPYACFPRLETDGTIAREQIVGTTRFLSVDSGAMLEEKDKVWRLSWLNELARNGFCCVLLNHPDTNFEELTRWVESLPQEKRLDWNLKQVAQWWNATHTRQGLNIKCKSQNCYELRASQDISALCLRVGCSAERSFRAIEHGKEELLLEWERCADRQSTRVKLDLKAGRPVELRITDKDGSL